MKCCQNSSEYALNMHRVMSVSVPTQSSVFMEEINVTMV